MSDTITSRHSSATVSAVSEIRESAAPVSPLCWRQGQAPVAAHPLVLEVSPGSPRAEHLVFGLIVPHSPPLVMSGSDPVRRMPLSPAPPDLEIMIFSVNKFFLKILKNVHLIKVLI